MTNNYRPTSSGWAILVLGVAALALGGCGRKGPLDLPPTASAQQPGAASGQQPVAAAADSDAERAAQPGVFNPTYGSDSSPTAPKGKKKPFILDPLLGN